MFSCAVEWMLLFCKKGNHMSETDSEDKRHKTILKYVLQKANKVKRKDIETD
jgi:hypothetical protein